MLVSATKADVTSGAVGSVSAKISCDSESVDFESVTSNSTEDDSLSLETGTRAEISSVSEVGSVFWSLLVPSANAEAISGEVCSGLVGISCEWTPECAGFASITSDSIEDETSTAWGKSDETTERVGIFSSCGTGSGVLSLLISTSVRLPHISCGFTEMSWDSSFNGTEMDPSNRISVDDVTDVSSSLGVSTVKAHVLDVVSTDTTGTGVSSTHVSSLFVGTDSVTVTMQSAGVSLCSTPRISRTGSARKTADATTWTPSMSAIVIVLSASFSSWPDSGDRADPNIWPNR